jgi:hypothetical protein
MPPPKSARPAHGGYCVTCTCGARGPWCQSLRRAFLTLTCHD